MFLTVAAASALVVGGLVWLGRNDRSVAPAAPQPVATAPAPVAAPATTTPLAEHLYVPARWSAAIAFIDATLATLSVDNVGFDAPGTSLDEVGLADGLWTMAQMAAVQPCMNSRGVRQPRPPHAPLGPDTQAAWDAYQAETERLAADPAYLDAASAAQEDCHAQMFFSRIDDRVFESLPSGELRPQLDATPYFDAEGLALVAELVECARAHGTVGADPATAPEAAWAEAYGVLMVAAVVPAGGPAGDAAAAELCPTATPARAALDGAYEVATREWMAAHPDDAAALVEAYSHNLAVFREILADDLEYIGSVELDGEYVGVAVKDQGTGLCLMVDEFYDSNGCDTVAAPFGPLTVRAQGDLVYGVFTGDVGLGVEVEGDVVDQATTDPVEYGGQSLRMFAALVGTGSTVTVTATEADGTVRATETFDM